MNIYKINATTSANDAGFCVGVSGASSCVPVIYPVIYPVIKATLT